MVLRTVGLLCLLVSVAACQPPRNNDSGPSYPSQTPERPYDVATISYPEPTTLVTATATFDRYNDADDLPLKKGLVNIQSGNPIRYAEVHILDAGGGIIQKGETDANGNISLRIPRTGGNFTLRVNSRADNSHYKVSVLKDPYSTEYYSLDQAFSLDGNQTTRTVSMAAASASNSGDVLGGAFNILDQVFVANEFLRSQANSVGCSFCVNDFTVAPKVQIFWKKGLTPAAYYGSPTSPISFFLSESGGGLYRGVYILGGIEGDVCTDTDHFDRSVILHEYGHFLENAFGKSASPGGSHNGNELLDPRLAWSEGWADFFQAAALGRSTYRDTNGNNSCPSPGARLSFPDFKLEEKQDTDVPTANEGIFREISIARTLYDAMTGPSQSSAYNMTNNTDSYAADLGFAPIWHSFKTAGTANYRFQDMGLLNTLMTGYVNGAYNSTTQTNYQNVLTYERQANNRGLYASTLNAGGSCSFSFTSGSPVPDTTSGGYVVSSDPLRNNDFYHYEYDGNTNNAVINLRYKSDTGGSNPYDLDLYVYRERHVLLDGSTIAAMSEKSFGQDENPPAGAYNGYERISLAGQPAGTYLINVKVYYQASRATTSYYLENANTGARLCP